MKGHMQKGKFHPHTQYKHVRNKSETPKTQGVIIRKQKTELSFEKAFQRFNSFVNSTSLEEFTFDPRTNKGSGFTNFKENKKFHRMYVIPIGSTNIVYIIGKTNNRVNEKTNVPLRLLESEYAITKNPFFGGFENQKGELFVDISFPFSGVSEEEAIAKAKNLGQESILFITPSGITDVIKTGIAQVPTKGFKPV